MPTLVPGTDNSQPLYLVLCDYGPKLGVSYYEADPDKSDRETVLQWLKEGQYTNPIEILEINKAAGTCRDVTAEFTEIVEDRAALRAKVVMALSGAR